MIKPTIFPPLDNIEEGIVRNQETATLSAAVMTVVIARGYIPINDDF